MTVEEIESGLQLYEITGRVWKVQMCNAVTGDGLSEGLQWLGSLINMYED